MPRFAANLSFCFKKSTFSSASRLLLASAFAASNASFPTTIPRQQMPSVYTPMVLSWCCSTCHRAMERRGARSRCSPGP